MEGTKSAKTVNTYDIREVICNPIYSGLGGFPKVISDEQWVKANEIAMKQDGKHRYLLNLFSILEKTFALQLKGKEEWIEKVEELLEKYDAQKVLADLLEFLKNFFQKEVVNKDIGKYYKKWRITSPIPVVILQIINIFRLILYIRIIESSNFEFINALTWLFKSSKSGFLNPPILEIELFAYHQYFCILKVDECGEQFEK